MEIKSIIAKLKNEQSWAPPPPQMINALMVWQLVLQG